MRSTELGRANDCWVRVVRRASTEADQASSSSSDRVPIDWEKEGLVLDLARWDLHTMKTVFTTGEAAKICKVSQQTIIRCFDSGQLKGFRVPGSRFRRIPRDALYRFMKENGIPTDALESGRRRVLIVDDDQAVVDLISEVLAGDARFETKVVNNGFGAGMLAKEYHPDLIILDVMLPDINGQPVCELIRAIRRWRISRSSASPG